MICVHEIEIKAKCPVNGQPDSYSAKVTIGRMILCEELELICQSFKGKKLHQEELTQELADLLQAKVETSGHHGSVYLTVTCEPKVVK